MKKMKSLFKREFNNGNIVNCLNEVEQECLWVIDGEGFATEKLDGTCCLIKDRQWDGDFVLIFIYLIQNLCPIVYWMMI